MTSHRVASLAGLSGVAGILCFGMFNLVEAASRGFPGAPFVSLALGGTALVAGIAALRTRPTGPERVIAWLGVLCGSVLTLAWIGIATLAGSAVLGHPM